MDLIGEGFDCVVRAGKVLEPGLIVKPIGELRVVNCVSPQYMAAHGVPLSLDDLPRHRLVHYVAILGGKSDGFEYVRDDQDHAVAMTGQVTVNNAVAYQAACVAGLGLIQAPVVGLRDLLARGQLVEVLPQFQARPMPLSLVYANRRNLSTRVRVVMDWLTMVMRDDISA